MLSFTYVCIMEEVNLFVDSDIRGDLGANWVRGRLFEVWLNFSGLMEIPVQTFQVKTFFKP